MKLSVVVFALFACGAVSAQEYAFKVLINKGQNQVKSDNDWLPIKVGASLASVDELKVAKNGYVGLVHVSGKPLEVKEAGRHKVVDLTAKIKDATSVLNKYTDFILSTKTDRQTNLTATGSVTRGAGEIAVFLPDPARAIVFNNEVAIAWARDQSIDTYVVRFNSMFGNELANFEVKDTTLTIDLNGKEFEQEDNIIVKVFSKNSPDIDSDDFVLKKLSAGDKKRVSSALSEMSSLTAEDNALNLLYLAAFYEDNGLLIDASTAYLQAVKLAPDVPHYQEAYHMFMRRTLLKN